MQPVISKGKTVLLNLTCVIGIIFLLLVGAFFDVGAPTLVKGHHAPADPHLTAMSCYYGAAIYGGLLAFGLMQNYLHNRNPNQHF
ncbi:hypothetical protein BCR44DRAFT_1497652 [Catenaria anguillulae PL171]|uniref:Uncharacterized protein n=1 Tax=Catenaria anguillulae PL171 TaxID=765915 RepID=A0A1Y2HU08_9FUNG|nr:hypothetical protein BCR44DRAFT_1497652 [Catenaria anguillulae PL171]